MLTEVGKKKKKQEKNTMKILTRTLKIGKKKKTHTHTKKHRTEEYRKTSLAFVFPSI